MFDLAAVILLCSYLESQTWSWSPSPPKQVVIEYCIYYARFPYYWFEPNRKCFNSTEVCNENICQGDISFQDLPNWDMIYFNLTAKNIAGESPWDHRTEEDIARCP